MEGATLISTTRFGILRGTTDPFPLHAPLAHDPPTDLALALAAMVQPGLVFRDEPSAATFAAGCLSARLTAHRTSTKPSGLFRPGRPGVVSRFDVPFPWHPSRLTTSLRPPPLDVADAFDRRVAEASFGHLPDSRPFFTASHKNFDLERPLTSPRSPQQFCRRLFRQSLRSRNGRERPSDTDERVSLPQVGCQRRPASGVLGREFLTLACGVTLVQSQPNNPSCVQLVLEEAIKTLGISSTFQYTRRAEKSHRISAVASEFPYHGHP